MTSVGIRNEHLGGLAEQVEEVLAELDDRQVVDRLWRRDHTVWSSDPTEITDRLGWLDVAGKMAGATEEISGFVAGCRADGLTDAVIMGMGGSSLFPEVLARSFPARDGALRLHVLDSTDPAAVAHIAGHSDPARTLYVASSKSGSTVETRSHLEFFWERVGEPRQFAAITDPGSELGALARDREFRHVFENQPDIGGRYSALSYFGLVPAALAGIDWGALIAGAATVSDALRSTDPARNPGLRLGAILGAAVRAGRDKATLLIDPRVATFGLWLEQLLAESTGKHGTGVVPVADEPLGPVDVYGSDRVFVSIGDVDQAVGVDALADEGHPVVAMDLGTPLDLGAQVMVWEVATAICGAVLGINPFDQPNVAEAKEATRKVLDEGVEDLPAASLREVLAQVRPGDYLALQAYIDPGAEEVDAYEEVRLALRDEHKVATTFGIGPRFLHSTGQLHKGGPPTGVFLQVVGVDRTDAPIPGQPFTFSQLKVAQADGDLLTLSRHGLRVARTTLDELVAHTAGGAS